MPLHDLHVRCLMYRVLISRDLFQHLLGLFTFLCLLIIYLSGLKLWLLEPMMLKLWKHVKFLILHRCGVPKVIISDRGTHVCNRTLGTLLAKYHVTHKVFTGYHPKQMAKLKSPRKRLRA